MEEANEQAAGSPPTGGGPVDGEPDPRLGAVVGGVYRLDERIGEGGMGTVYRATHIHLGKGFAVKVLADHAREKPEAVERLRQEAVTASGIEHDHIVNILSFDRTDQGEVFIVMELLRGQSLHALLSQGPLPLRRAVPIAQQIAWALQATHARGIVHRDLKPENVFVMDKGGADFVKVLDFGISKVRSAEAERVRVTRTGQLVGTPLYMSPEQARGEADVDLRADVYAVGVLLYEMLTGAPPFEGRNYFQLLWKHGNEPPEPPSRRAPAAHIPDAVESVVLRALQKDPAARFASMGDLDQALAAAAPEHALSAGRLPSSPSYPEAAPGLDPDPRGSRRGRRGPTVGRLAGLSTAAIAVAALATWAWVSPRPEPAPPGDAPGPTDTAPAAPSDTATAKDAPAGESEAPDDDIRADDAPPAPLEVTFESDPPGAQVHIGDELLGTTPLVAPLAPDDTPHRVRFSLRGYRDTWLEVAPGASTHARARLEPHRRPRRTPPRTLPMKTEL
jgi:eukaryotic-like serine/threonine-protein kinase